MGWETANVHLGNRQRIKAVRKHLRSQKPDWLYGAARQMVAAVKQDWQAWKRV